MRDEIEKVREQFKFYSIPQRTTPDEPPVPPSEVVSRRRSMRICTDEFIDKALMNGDAPTLLRSLCEVMTATAGTCAGLGLDPDVSDLLLGAKDLVEDVRVLIDKGIGVREYDQVKVGCAMMEIVCIGMAAVLGLPYREALAMAHSKYLNAEDTTREDFRDLLIAHGFTQLKEETDDDSPSAA